MTRIDLTPTWAGLVPAFRAIVENGTQEGRAAIWQELARMAALADLYAAHVRAQDAAPVAPVAPVAPPSPLSDALASARVCLAAFPESDLARQKGGAAWRDTSRDLRSELADLSDAAAPAVGELARLKTGVADALAALTSPHYGELENLADHAADARAILETLTKGL